MMTKDEIMDSGLLEQYVLGLTSDEENEIVFEAIKNYPEINDYLKGIEQTMEMIAHQHAILPPKDLRAKTFSKIAEGEKLNLGSTKLRTILDVLGAVAGLVLLALTIFYYQANNEGEIALEKKDKQLLTLITDCDKRTEDLNFKTSLLNLYEDENYTTYKLAKSGLESNEGIVVFWDDVKEKAFLHNASLRNPPPGKTYQIWADVDNVMMPLGIFDDNSHLVEIRCLKKATSLNVTIEPEGGSDHPDVSNLILSRGV
jgi:anti-sigma-K factor RskA